MIPNLKIFTEEVFNILTDREKTRLFYWSLFDPSSWENEDGLEKLQNIPSFEAGKREISKLLKKGKTFRKQLKTNKDFFKEFVYGEYLTNYILAAAITKKIAGKSKVLDFISQRIRKFPDIIISHKKKKIFIEIKRLSNPSNMLERIESEIISKLKENKRIYKRFLLLLVIPSLKKEDPERVQQLISGYYIYERKIPKGSIKRNGKVLCRCIANPHYRKDCKQNLENLVDKIVASSVFGV